jgi:hypothetical protein
MPEAKPYASTRLWRPGDDVSVFKRDHPPFVAIKIVAARNEMKE